MGFRITTRDATAGDKSGTVYELADAAGTVRAEVWPFTGFNCLRWQVRQPDGSWGNILYAAPDWETNPVPTRSGHPILFPFPGRLQGGRLTFGGQTYQLPLNDSSKSHAIHGFTPRNAWRVVGTDAGPDAASVVGEFQLSRDLPDAANLWPADFKLLVVCTLDRVSLSIHATVANLGPLPLPSGLGYHAYFTIPRGGDESVDRLVLKANVTKLWEAEESIPTGRTVPLPVDLDFRAPRPVGMTHLDHVFTGVDAPVPDAAGLMTVAELSANDRPGRLTVAASHDFRELVLFTPPHRKAVAIEPYTCAADAANLQARGIDAGWRTLVPGGIWESMVVYQWDAAGVTRSIP